MTRSLIERFEEKYIVNNETGCWDWIACKNGTGYGQINKNGTGYGQINKNGKMVLAHRVSYELFKGEIPKSKELDHLCRNRGCVNPDHLEAVTQMENMRRSPITNMNKTHCPQGHAFTSKNIYTDKRGTRQCKICCTISAKAYRDKKDWKGNSNGE